MFLKAIYKVWILVGSTYKFKALPLKQYSLKKSLETKKTCVNLSLSD